MKRLNKKGFTLVELLAAIVILAVLMLVGAQAVAGIMRSSRANSLLSSLDMAAKQANTKIAQGELTSKESNLKDVLNYNDKDYLVGAYTTSDGNNVITYVKTQIGGGFATVKCDHGKIKDNVYTGSGSTATLKTFNSNVAGYYCQVEGTGANQIIKVYKVEKIAN